MMRAPLAGITVIEVGQALAGPLAGSILGDMGADVIKIEKPDGGDDARLWGPPFVDGDALAFRAYNRNKRSITLDIKNADDIATLKTLARDAPFGPTSVVTTNDMFFGMAMMLAILSDLHDGPKVAVFRTFDEGLDWLIRTSA